MTTPPAPGDPPVDLWPGPGPVVVLLHAGVCDRRSWRQVAPALAGSAAVVAPDRRGFGAAPPSTEPFTHVDDLLDLVRRLDELLPGVRRATTRPVWLVGSSMGGGLALDTALTAPDLVAGLVLLAPAVSGAAEPELDADTRRLDAALERAYDAGDLDEVNRLETWLWLDGPAQPEGRVGGPARDLALEMNAVVIGNDVAEGAGGSGVTAWDRLDEVRCPTVVACGALDVPFIRSRSRDLAARLPRARYVDLPGRAHLPYLEDPAGTAALVATALAQPA